MPTARWSARPSSSRRTGPGGSPISVQGQRGDPVRLLRDIQGAVEDAWRQGSRAREYLLRARDAVFTDEHGTEVLRIPPGRVHEVIIVNPTLHDLAGFAQQLPRLGALGLFEAGEYPWSVFINDLRVIAETRENATVFLHYLVWRNRLPLGDRITVSHEIDLWGSYLFGERFTGLEGGGRMIIGNASTDFDAYYDGLAGRGPERAAPRKFSQSRARVRWGSGIVTASPSRFNTRPAPARRSHSFPDTGRSTPGRLTPSCETFA